ncbi:MAG: SDR family oxidoreductase [Longimicrobiales bacterium]
MTRPWGLTGSSALITGALGLLGPVWIRGLLEAGARVVALDLPNAKISDQYTALADTYNEGQLRLVRADITDRVSLTEIHAWCVRHGSVPSILLNNAGMDQSPALSAGSFTVADIPPELFRSVFDVNVLGTFQMIQTFGPEMVRAGQGSIINIASLYATVSPDQRLYDHLPMNPPFLKPPAYGASKAAVVNLTRYFATLWAPYGVRVNALSPGGVLADQDEEFRRKYSARVPMGRMAEPKDLTGPLIFLASDASRYVTGINLQVDGGFTAW